MRRIGIILFALLLAACTSSPAAVQEPPRQTNLHVDVVARGLEHGWDIGFLPDGKLRVTQRPGRLSLVDSTGAHDVSADLSDVYARGEGGLMGLVVHPDFARSRRFTMCQTHQEGGQAVDIRLTTWALSPDERSAAKVRDLLTGLPVNPSGRHSGCRPALAADGALLVGTGDTAQPSIAQDRHSLGGKVLRIDLQTGGPLPDNPFISSADANEQRIYSYGHRNVQGVTVRPGTGQVFTAEHGPTFDDEINLNRAGGNYGWDPSKGGTDTSYDESVPMTDTDRFPDAVRPLWTSGKITEAICGAAFLTGAQWGPLEGRLAVVALKGQKLLLFSVDAQGSITDVTLPAEFDDKYGRLRAARTAPDGALYVTTSDGSDDKVLRVTPGV
ncbi:PQQ-dependent sugar dehydrogenase [Amycolatopsis acidiphila]|uniref:PQQ-dependent sugar dehydrogenase n=1 Tax=Amycolatopsis acidiphila TaxID=715473 RepID=A0A558A907_9PSEU|nr:PQQ-dependent sugar dehydrogenase [Amycolatopsis acidiphila]TVT20744.1 PQQ-dependent sugar dehydrogenase [Amycolatopsis acidiphila]UIJ59045.1 PQQ-dependent sugar dehydrogenase [Amycolatopsis acidiphila]GHG73553.1 glucose dehydrogenase [Amycolatopsis acidiphila]